MRGRWPPDIAECKALLYGVQLAKRYGFKHLILEGDCQVVINRLKKASTFLSDLDSLLDDVLSIITFFDFISFSHVKRDGNFVSHHLARLVPFGFEQVWENHCPIGLSPYVLMDKLSSVTPFLVTCNTVTFRLPLT
ncbi:uncharacterized protein [Spinacia oleracea]|uniref:RNase H type-1 domain-containing protein n=1 Tax=Spinacia oleracea TaxID=3562 RepID=A0A9R0I4S5_SPIOL|nr:uncharacterized protein LOC110782619 [Spinacia oleracea]